MKKIKISKKFPRGDDGHKIISLRIPLETLAQLETLATKTDRSRNELINMLLQAALDNVTIEE